MATAKPILLIFIFIFIFIFIISSFLPLSDSSHPTPTPWPNQFRSLMYYNTNGSLQITDLYYDWPNGRNFNIIQKQLGSKIYDVEWTNGTSFYYTLDSAKECRTMHFGVGILPPNWLDGADYLGQEYVDGFLCNVWTKVDFIWYYEDVVTKRPVHWLFYDVLEDSKWQAPVYCFEEEEEKEKKKRNSEPTDATLDILMQTKIALKGLMGFSM